jgi:hypothetical protein
MKYKNILLEEKIIKGSNAIDLKKKIKNYKKVFIFFSKISIFKFLELFL